MATARKWSSVGVAMQSVIGAAIPITSVSKATQGLVTTAGLVPAVGAYVLLSAQGMYQIDGRVFRVAASPAPTATTFSLEGEDTTLYDTFTSGSYALLTLGTSITSATSINASGGDFDFIDTTTIHGNVKTQIPGLPSAASFDFDNIWDVSDAGLLAMKVAADNQATRAFKFTFGSGGQIMVFNGYVGATLLPGGTAQQLITTKSVITMFGRPTYYAS